MLEFIFSYKAFTALKPLQYPASVQTITEETAKLLFDVVRGMVDKTLYMMSFVKLISCLVGFLVRPMSQQANVDMLRVPL